MLGQCQRNRSPASPVAIVLGQSLSPNLGQRERRRWRGEEGGNKPNIRPEDGAGGLEAEGCRTFAAHWGKIRFRFRGGHVWERYHLEHSVSGGALRLIMALSPMAHSREVLCNEHTVTDFQQQVKALVAVAAPFAV
ncbi:hypothetical protein B0H14DRAFT_2583651 [Mycena olivaceomarginata]|nr:hypothetical protein B0H14DRAFT_2583651 [Mycena olivaceomarginata]